jgi:hypothetical protein
MVSPGTSPTVVVQKQSALLQSLVKIWFSWNRITCDNFYIFEFRGPAFDCGPALSSTATVEMNYGFSEEEK